MRYRNTAGDDLADVIDFCRCTQRRGVESLDCSARLMPGTNLLAGGDCSSEEIVPFLELDEMQLAPPPHHQPALLSDDLPLAFGKRKGSSRCGLESRLEGGEFAKPRPPLFPELDACHQERTSRDSLADILPTCHNFLPTSEVTSRSEGGSISMPQKRRWRNCSRSGSDTTPDWVS
jgi:hypothetical protein